MHPVQSPDEQRANAVYDALLWSLSRPGLRRTLPEAGEAQIVDALIDRECRAYAQDPRLIPLIMRTGAEVVDIPNADHLFLGALQDCATLNQVAQGTDLYPDDGATIVLKADLQQGQRLRLSGPGVQSATEITVGGLPEGFWDTRARAMRYPMGFEIFLLHETQVVGIPRSTQVEVL